MATTFQLTINGGPFHSFASLGLALPRIATRSLQADVATVEHIRRADGSLEGLDWLSDPLIPYAADVSIYRVEGGARTRVFRGKRRRAPRFCGVQAKRISYTIEGPWGWLQRRALLQNCAVPPSEGSGPPNMVPQGLVILGQDDTGSAVNLGQAITTIINDAITIGVPITLGSVVGFNFQTGWDWSRDLTHADAITRLLQVVPDAVVEWDYATPKPTVHFRRWSGLEAKTLSIAPEGTPVADFGPDGYAELETVSIEAMEDMVVPGVWLDFRAIDNENGDTKLRVTPRGRLSHVDAKRTDENAISRTVELAGAVITSHTVEQKCVTAIIPLGVGENLTPANGALFDGLRQFLARSEAWLVEEGTTVRKLSRAAPQWRRALEPDSETGEMKEVTIDHSLVREMVEGAITPWMEEGSLNRKGQEQEIIYEVEADRTIDGEKVPYNATITRSLLATNCSTRTYTWEESRDETPAEPIPEGLVDAIYEPLSRLQYDGQFTLVERECSFGVRVGQAINLTGEARPEWAEMHAIVQSVSYDLQSRRSTVEIGFPRYLGLEDLIAIWRSNRSRQPADRGLVRASGRF